MKIRNVISAMAATVVACAALTAPAHAADYTGQIMQFVSTHPTSPFSFVQNGAGDGGTLVTASPNGTSVIGLSPTNAPSFATIEFTGLDQVEGSAVDNGAGKISANFKPGGFVLRTSPGGAVLLQGTFGVSTFTAENTGSATTGSLLKLDFADVIYDNTSPYAVQFMALPGSQFDPQLTGTFSLTFQGVTPTPLGVTGLGGLNAFTTTGFQGGFTATADGKVNINPVPEPEEYAVMGMASLALCGLMLRARRRSAGRTMGGFAA